VVSTHIKLKNNTNMIKINHKVKMPIT